MKAGFSREAVRGTVHELLQFVDKDCSCLGHGALQKMYGRPPQNALVRGRRDMTLPLSLRQEVAIIVCAGRTAAFVASVID